MRPNKRSVSLFLALAVCAGLVPDLAGQKAKSRKEPAPDLNRSIIRKELLAPKQGEIPPPLRDIFSPKASFAPQIAPLQTSPTLPAENPQKSPEEGSPVAAGPLEVPINLVYVGYVRSRQKMIALVLYEGQPMAVAEGEDITPGFKIEKVSSAQLDVLGPDSKRKSFSLQGE